jgi:hypothetical protein
MSIATSLPFTSLVLGLSLEAEGRGQSRSEVIGELSGQDR